MRRLIVVTLLAISPAIACASEAIAEQLGTGAVPIAGVSPDAGAIAPAASGVMPAARPGADLREPLAPGDAGSPTIVDSLVSLPDVVLSRSLLLDTETTLTKPINFNSEIRRAKRQKARKVSRVNKAKALFSRTARFQIALFAAKSWDDFPGLAILLDGKDADSGADVSDFHVCYSRPKLSKALLPDEDLDIPESVKLRLFMARMKAVRVHQESFGYS